MQSIIQEVGPWIKGMDTSNINMLGYYDRVKNGLPKNN